MDEGKKELVRNWLIKAQHDNASAKKLSEGDTPTWIQQSITVSRLQRKLSKAFLFFTINGLKRHMICKC
jgi:hypothetical protein